MQGAKLCALARMRFYGQVHLSRYRTVISFMASSVSGAPNYRPQLGCDHRNRKVFRCRGATDQTWKLGYRVGTVHYCAPRFIKRN